MATGKSKSIVSGKNLQGRSAAAAASNKHAIAATKAVADSPDISPHASESRSSTATDRVLANIPVVYGDQVMDVVYGIHTSKVVFGVETGTGTLRAVGVAIVPTASLLTFATNLIRDLSAPSIIEETANRFAGVLSMMRELAPGSALPAGMRKRGR